MLKLCYGFREVGLSSLFTCETYPDSVNIY